MRYAKRAMHPRWPLLLTMAGILFVGAGCGSTPVLQNMPTADVNVQFTDDTLEPVVAHVKAGGNVVWISEATTYVGAVVLPATIKDGLTCDDLRPQFDEVAYGYLSQPISGMVENVKLPCPLKAGSYDYELRLYEPNFGGPDEPVETLKGTIVVE